MMECTLQRTGISKDIGKYCCLSCKTLLQLLKEGEWLDSIDEHIFQGTGTYIKRCIGSVAVLAAKDF